MGEGGVDGVSRIAEATVTSTSLLRARLAPALHASTPDSARTQLTADSLGLGSVSREQMESSTLLTVSAGLHWSLRMSRQMPPLLLMLQW
jgi:hypothetical protein